MALVIQENIALRGYTTLKTGGFARYFIVVKTVADLLEAATFAKETALPIFILGSGSNLLIADQGFAGVVIKIDLLGMQYSAVTEDGSATLTVQAGESLDGVVADSVQNGFWGLENLSAIPGTVGATPVQNVGAYGVEVGNLISAVETIHIPTNTIKIFTNKECNFSYRDSFFKTNDGQQYIITSVSFLLNKNSQPKIAYADFKQIFQEKIPTVQEVRDAVISIRAQKFPNWHIVGTAGSFFKNPIIPRAEALALQSLYPELPLYEVDENNLKIPLGFVLDKICSLKGFSLGRVGLYEKQALVLVHDGDATADEIINFVSIITKKVYEKTKIKIEPEVRFVGIGNL